MLKEGDIVPNGLSGILVDSDGSEKTISLSSLSKEHTLVLYFYPRDLTPGCTTEAQNFRNDLAKFKEINTSIIGVSKDDVSSHNKFISKHNLNFPLLSDLDGSIVEAFGVWQLKKFMGKEFMGIVRSTFVIRDNKIIKVYPKVKVKEHSQQILADIVELNP